MNNEEKVVNFLPNQYSSEKFFSINHNYLSDQFSDYDVIFNKIKKVIKSGNATFVSTIDIAYPIIILNTVILN